MKAVLDTNILVSGLIKRGEGGIPDRILRRVNAFQLCLSEEILGETNDTLHYDRIFKKYHLTETAIQEYLAYLRIIANMIDRPSPVDVIQEDPNDNMIIACALAVQADFVVSGDRHLKDLEEYRDVRVLSPREFLDLLLQ